MARTKLISLLIIIGYYFPYLYIYKAELEYEIEDALYFKYRDLGLYARDTYIITLIANKADYSVYNISISATLIRENFISRLLFLVVYILILHISIF